MALTDATIEKLAALPATRVVVVGGGRAGLVTARECAVPGFAVTLVEARDGPDVEVAGLRLDAAPAGFVPGERVDALTRDLGLTDRVEAPATTGLWVGSPRRVAPLPRGGLLGIPASPLARDVARAIGWGGAVRAYLDRLRPVFTIGHERELARLVRRRMGATVLDRLVAPVTRMRFGLDPEDVDVAGAAPGLNTALTRQGTLSGAVGELGDGGAVFEGLRGLEGGMPALVATLEEELRRRGATVRAGVRVAALAAGAGGDARDSVESDRADPDADADERTEGEVETPAPWTVRLDGGEEIPADVVVLAVSEAETRRLLRTAHGAPAAETPRLAGDGPPADGPVDDCVVLVVDAPALDAVPRRAGVLAARLADAPRPAVRWVLHESAVWPWLARVVGPGRHILRVAYAATDTDGLDAPVLLETAVRDAARLLGVPLDAESVVGWSRAPWRRRPAPAVRGKQDRADAIHASAAGLDGVEVTGGWSTGDGLEAIVDEAISVARRARALRWRQVTDDDAGSE